MECSRGREYSRKFNLDNWARGSRLVQQLQETVRYVVSITRLVFTQKETIFSPLLPCTMAVLGDLIPRHLNLEHALKIIFQCFFSTDSSLSSTNIFVLLACNSKLHSFWYPLDHFLHNWWWLIHDYVVK